ncbi:hypothetical protein [Catellatospora sp. NPDC049609]
MKRTALVLIVAAVLTMFGATAAQADDAVAGSVSTPIANGGNEWG